MTSRQNQTRLLHLPAPHQLCPNLSRSGHSSGRSKSPLFSPLSHQQTISYCPNFLSTVLSDGNSPFSLRTYRRNASKLSAPLSPAASPKPCCGHQRLSAVEKVTVSPRLFGGTPSIPHLIRGTIHGNTSPPGSLPSMARTRASLAAAASDDSSKSNADHHDSHPHARRDLHCGPVRCEALSPVFPVSMPH